MFRNYFKIAIRSLLKDRQLSFINIFGLAAGLACALLMVLYIRDELSYDRYAKDPESIYRVVKDFANDDGTKLPDATTPPALAPALKRELPEVEEAVRIFPNWSTKFLLKYDDKQFYEEGVYRADSNVFAMFQFPFVQGRAEDALSRKDAIVFTETAAGKYFSDKNPVGKIVDINGKACTVSAVMKDVPAASHFTFDFLLPVYGIDSAIDQRWGFYNFYTYVRLRKGTDINAFTKRVQAIFQKNDPERKRIFYTQPLTDIHLKSDLKWELRPNGSVMYVYVFGIVAIFLIVIAAINYINLVTAKSSLRGKEIGMRKVIGAQRNTPILQLLTESVLIVVISGALAVLIAFLLLPVFNNVTGKSIALAAPGSWIVWCCFAAFILLIGVLAGLYPALYLSAFRPAVVLKGFKMPRTNTITLRRALIVLQFTISITLIIGSLVIRSQLSYMQSTRLGFNKDNIMVIRNTERSSRQQAFHNALRQVPGIKNVTGVDGMPGGLNSTFTTRYKESQNNQLVNYLNVGYDFIDLMDIRMVRGRNFAPAFPGDSIDAIILNEKAVKDLAIPEPVIGQQVVWSETKDTTIYAKVVGVVRDFHFTSLHNEIKPFAFTYTPSLEKRTAFKVEMPHAGDAINQVQSIWSQYYPDRPFDYYFLDESIDRLYRADRDFKTLFSFFTVIALMIACLGLFGLAAFTTEQRTKEIGIRKVLGATVTTIVAMLSKDFLKLIIVAALIAFPLAAWFMHGWLQDFAYRIHMPWWSFGIALMLAAGIALLTISTQAIKAAVASPVKSLRAD